MRRRAARAGIAAATIAIAALLFSCEHELSETVARLVEERSQRPRITLVYLTSADGEPVSLSSGDTVDYGTLLPNQSVERIFRIRNEGDAVLKLTGIPTISISGSGAFDPAGDPASEVDANGGFTEFRVTYAPAEPVATASATVEIVNDDPDRNPFRFRLSGSCEATGPQYDGAELSMTFNTTGDPVQRDDAVDLGAEDVTYALTRSFSITNTGDQVLELTGPPYVALADSDAFSISVQPSPAIDPGESTEFTVQFLPDDLGFQTNTVVVESNDRHDTTFSFAVEATGLEFSGKKDLYAAHNAASLDLDVDGHHILVTAQAEHEGNRTATLIESTDGGLTFAEISGAAEVLAQDCYLDTVLAGDTLHVAGVDSESGSVMYSRTDDHGLHWSHSTVASGGTISQVSLGVRNPELPDATLFVSYYDADVDTIRVTTSEDGLTWTTPYAGPANPAGPHRLVDDGTTLHVGYLDDSGRFVYSTSSDGESWTSTPQYDFAGAPPEADRNIAAFANGSGDILFTFTSNADGSPYRGLAYTSANDAVSLYDAYGSPVGYSDIAAKGSVACTAAYDRETNDLLFFKTGNYQADGPSWEVTTVESSGDIGISCKVAIDGNRAYIVGAENGTNRILFAKSLNGGTSWE